MTHHQAIDAPAVLPLPALNDAAAAAGSGCPAQVPEWVMLARTGAWLGHPNASEEVTPERLQSALDYFDRHYAAHGAELVIDYHHASVIAPVRGMLAPAAGWVRRMELRADGSELWGRVMWTSEAAAAIGRRQFRHLSPVLRFGTRDRVTGRPVAMTIHSVALTNTPFLTELESLNSSEADTDPSSAAAALEGAANDAPAEGGESMPLLNAIAEALGEPPEELASRLGLQSVEDREVAATLVAGAAADVEARAGAARLPDFVADSLGVPAGADDTAIRAAIIRLKAPGAGLTAVRTRLGLADGAPESEVLNCLDGLLDSRRRDDAQELVDEAVAAGKIPPAHREFYLNEARNNLDAARQVIDALPVLTARQRTPASARSRELGESERAVCAQLGLSADAFLAAVD